MTKLNSKTKKFKKSFTKKILKSKLTQKGGKGGTFTTENVENINYKYNKSEMPNNTYSLICKTSNCGSKKFKQKTMKIPTKAQSWWKPTYLENTTYFFTCVNCGSIEVLSTDITITQSQTKSDSEV
jgi:hypothetical protein